MPESYHMFPAPEPDTRVVVGTFYTLLRRKDADGLSALIDECFAPDVVMRWPESLPYGGTVKGAEDVKRLMAGMASAPNPIVDGTKLVVEKLTGPGDDVVVELSFPWLAPGAEEPVPMRSAEWWHFSDGRVTEVDAFYWDTAACAEQVRAASAAQTA